jgi:acylphosphatase
MGRGDSINKTYKMKTVRIIISGRVQGVFFRAETKQKADKLRLLGWVRNNSDGTVEAILQGENSAVDGMVEWCYKGSLLARVEKVEVKEIQSEKLEKFEIRN